MTRRELFALLSTLIFTSRQSRRPFRVVGTMRRMTDLEVEIALVQREYREAFQKLTDSNLA